MKLFNFAIISVLLSTLSIACSKDDAAPSATPSTTKIEGVYTGKYGFDNTAPDKNYTLNFKSNGTIQEIGQSSGNPTGQGTFTLSGNHVTATYKMLFAPYNDYFIVATYDASSNTISGTWGYEAGGTDGGNFSLQKN